MTAAEAQAWPHRKDVVILVNPSKRKIILRTIVFVGILIAVVMVMSTDDSPLSKWAKEQDQQADREKLAPTMERLAAQGKRDAIIWISHNIPENDGGRLAALAYSGDGEALFLRAMEKAKTDVSEAKRLLVLSADAGYLPAVKMSLNVHRHKVIKWE